MTTLAGVPHTSRTVDLAGPVHYLDYGGPDGAPVVVGVHGLGGSHLNWAAVAPHLIGRSRLVAVDLLGHGHTPTAGRSPDVEGHVALLAGFAAEVSDRPVILMGNSLGGLVAALTASAAPDRVAGLILVDPALPTERLGMVHPRVLSNFVLCSVPGVGERYLNARRNRSTAEQKVRRVLGATCVDPARVPVDVVDAHIALTEAGDRAAGDRAYLASARSLSWVMARSGPTMVRLDALDLPVLHLHGARDLLVPLAAARRMAEGRPNWQLEVARDIGHAPMLETPVWTALRIDEWLDGAGAEAWARAGGPDEPAPPAR
ncbi:MAG TPA: alpha/beta hydrolase [Acidimicrobiales bacterium]